MFGWYRRLMPREDRFFDMFNRHTEAIVRGAEALRAMLDGGDAVRQFCPIVLKSEHEADHVVREVSTALRRTFVTPFDRGDIQSLVTLMDDTIDEMKKSAKAIVMFEMTSFGPDFPAIGDTIVACAHLLHKAVPLMGRMTANAQQINALCEEIRAVESRADRIHEAGMTALLHGNTQPFDALRFITTRNVLDLLERVVDRFDDVADEIENIVVEHV